MAVRSAALAVLFILAGFDPVRGVIVGIQTWRQEATYDRCMAAAGDDDWQCEAMIA